VPHLLLLLLLAALSALDLYRAGVRLHQLLLHREQMLRTAS
jgi:hypothetical protein